MKPFIGIKNVWYGEVITEKPTIELLSAWIKNAKKVENVHEGTWGYEQSDPETTDYKNELNGSTYYRDKTSNGDKTINFTLGVYAFSDRKELCGGQLLDDEGAEAEAESAVMWEAPDTMENIYKAILAETKTGNFILFPYAGIIAKNDTQEKNIGLGVAALALDDSSYPAVKDEYMLDGNKVKVANGEFTKVG